MLPRPNCKPRHHCHVCGKPIVCGDNVVVPYHASSPRYRARHAECSGDTGWHRVYHCSTACYWRQLRARRRKERMRTIACKACGGTFQTLHRDARFCSKACRQYAYRRRKAVACIT
jgi:hypothetical protein